MDCHATSHSTLYTVYPQKTCDYVPYDEIGHFLCSVISQGKVVALDRWGGKWNQLWM